MDIIDKIKNGLKDIIKSFPEKVLEKKIKETLKNFDIQ